MGPGAASMNRDISNLLREWAFQPGQINARMITGQDGEPRVQVRLDLGLIQMFADGRPDGERPFGYPSLLEYYEAQIEQADEPETAGVDQPKSDKLSLSPDDCRALREEAAQFYQRYLALLVLEDYDRVVRDTTRNLRVLDLCQKHAQTEEDRAILEQFRPYITMMRSRALASQALKDNEPKAAIHALDEGLEALRMYFSEVGKPQAFEQSTEVEMLKGMRDALIPKLPVSQKSELKQRLAKAIEQENYELAAILRDELKQIKDPS
jgi:UvrB/uvrC motif